MKAFLLCLAAMPLLSAPSRIYVTNSDDNKVTVIDPASDKVVDEIAVSPNPHGIVPSPDGSRFYVSSESKDVLDVVDRKTSQSSARFRSAQGQTTSRSQPMESAFTFVSEASHASM
jgi:YVTN family beta-propeller protein